MSDRGQRERRGVAPSEQWWAINGEDLLWALRRCKQGDDPDVVYLELLANSGEWS